MLQTFIGSFETRITSMTRSVSGGIGKETYINGSKVILTLPHLASGHITVLIENVECKYRASVIVRQSCYLFN